MDIITSHNSLDFDGLASMVAAGKLYPRAVKVLSGTLSDNVKRFYSLYKDLLVLKTPREVDLNQVSRLVVVDTKNPHRLARLKGLAERPGIAIHIFDHHTRSGDDLVGEFVHDEPLGATTTLLVEMIKAANVKITPFEATVMALGIYEDTGCLLFTSTTPRDAAAVAYLLEQGANLSVVDGFIEHGLSSAQSLLLQRLISTSRHYNINGIDVLIATAETDEFIEGLDVITYRLAEIEPADAVFTVARMEGKANIVARSKSPNVRVNDILAVFGGRGHDKAASAVAKEETAKVADVLLERCRESIRPALLAKDIMSSPVKSVESNMSIEEAGRIMLRYGHTGMPVVEGERMVGIISRRDVDKAKMHKLGHAPVKGFMSRNIVALPPETPVSEVKRVMVEKDIGRVPIVDGERVVGIISRTDILRTIHGDSSDIDDYAALWLAGSKEQNISNLIEERLPGDVIRNLRMAGKVAERIGCRVYAVGGFVRDLLLAVPNFDIDLVVEGDGIAFAEALAEEANGRCRKHERFRTAVVIMPDGSKIDVATARTEYYEFPAALPKVEASSIKEDLYRRDFTINAMAICLNPDAFGHLLDFFGGWRDMENGLIRVLYNLSFVEDPTRIIRAIRFEQRYRFKIEPETLRFARDAVQRRLLGELSFKRILNELILVLNEKDPVPALKRMEEIGVWEYVLPEARLNQEKWTLLRRIPNLLVWMEERDYINRYRPWLVYLIVLCHDVGGSDREKIIERYPLDRKAVRALRLASTIQELAVIINGEPDMALSKLDRYLNHLEEELLIYSLLLVSNEDAFQRVTEWLNMRYAADEGLNGHDLKRLGLKPGPSFQKALQLLREARLDKLVSTRSEEEELVKKWIAEGRLEAIAK